MEIIVKVGSVIEPTDYEPEIIQDYTKAKVWVPCDRDAVNFMVGDRTFTVSMDDVRAICRVFDWLRD